MSTKIVMTHVFLFYFRIFIIFPYIINQLSSNYKQQQLLELFLQHRT